MPMKLRGIDKTRRHIKKFKDQGLEEAAQKGVDRSIAKLFADSQIQVPKKTRLLMNSATIDILSGSGHRRSSSVKYGDTALNNKGESYAAAVHEILDASHDLPTKAKYVEDPLKQNVPYDKRVTMYECRRQVRRIFR